MDKIWISSNDNSGFVDKFLEEYNNYPHNATKDILDTLGHALQNLNNVAMSDKEFRSFITEQQQRQQQLNSHRSIITGY